MFRPLFLLIFILFIVSLGRFMDEVWVANDSGPFGTQTIKQMSISEWGLLKESFFYFFQIFL